MHPVSRVKPSKWDFYIYKSDTSDYSSSRMAVLELFLILSIVVGIVVLVVIGIARAKKPSEIGGPCVLHEDCIGYGLGPSDVACCGPMGARKCTKKINGWCPDEGPNVTAVKTLEQSCTADNQCRDFNHPTAPTGCCGGKCRSKCRCGTSPLAALKCPTDCDGTCIYPESTTSPVCGNAARVFQPTETEWGDYSQPCSRGTSTTTLTGSNFPVTGSMMSWTCSTDQQTIPCTATHSYPSSSETGSLFNDGNYKIYQVSLGQYLDVSGDQVVVRNGDGAVWRIEKVGTDGSAHIIHSGTNQYLDAYEISANDFNVVLRPAQNNASQVWVFVPDDTAGQWRIRQSNTGRWLDAYQNTNSNRVVTRTFQGDSTQEWVIVSV